MTISQANMRLSAVDGTAFVDFSAAGLLTDHIGKRLTVLDSAGKKLIGFIKAVGTGETLDTELLADPGFDNAGSWSTNTSFVIAGSVATATALATDKFVATSCPTTGKLIKFDITVSGYASGGLKAFLSGGIRSINEATGNGPLTSYLIANDLTFAGWITSQDNSTYVVDTASMKQVLTPSATGVTIVSTPGGAIYNWEYKEAGFNYNDPAGYEYLITNQRAIFANYYRQMRAA